MNYSAIALMVGPTLPMLGMVAASIYGARQFAEQNAISQIDIITEGEFKGLLRAKINKTALTSYTVIINPLRTYSLCALGDDDIGADDCESNLLQAFEYIDEATGKMVESGVFYIPADAHRDKTTMEWLYAMKDFDSETDALYNEVIL